MNFVEISLIVSFGKYSIDLWQIYDIIVKGILSGM